MAARKQVSSVDQNNQSFSNVPDPLGSQDGVNKRTLDLGLSTKVQIGGDIGGTVTSPIVKSKTAITVGTSNANYIAGTDAYGALNSAIISANAAGGGQVYVKYGSYNINTILPILDNVQIVADPGTTFTFNSTSYINIVNKSNIVFKGINFVTQGQMAIRSAGHKNLRIMECNFTGASSVDGMVVLNGSLGVSASNFEGTYIEDCIFKDITGGQSVIQIYPRNGHMSYDFFSVRNKFDNTTGMTIYLNVYDYAYNTNIIKCSFKNLKEAPTASVGYGSALAFQTRIATNGPRYAVGITIDDCDYEVTNLAPGSKGQGFCFAYNYSDLRLTRNRAKGSWTTSNNVVGPFFAPGRTTEVCEYTYFEENTIIGFDSPIDHDSSRFMTIARNKVSYCGHGLIPGYQIKEDLEIIDNYEYECGSVYGAAYGAYMALGTANKVRCRISRNVFYSTDTRLGALMIANGQNINNDQLIVSDNRFIFPNSTVTEIYKKEFANSLLPKLENFTGNEIVDSTGTVANLNRSYSALLVPESSFDSTWATSLQVPTKKAVYESLTGKQAKFTITVGTTGDAGYVTDGVADEVQINAAINAVNTAGGGVVLLQTGTFTTAASIVLKSNVTLIGSGMNKTIITGASTDYSLVNTPKSTTSKNVYSNITVSNLTLKSNYGTCLSINNTTNVIVSIVEFYFVSTTPIRQTLFTQHCQNVLVYSCYAHDYTGNGLSVTSTDYFNISNNIIVGGTNGDDGIDVDFDFLDTSAIPSNYGTVVGNTVRTIGRGNGIRIENSNSVTVSGNTVDGVTSTASIAAGIIVNSTTTNVATAISVTGNTVTNCVPSGISTSGNNMTNISIVGNTITNSGQNGGSVRGGIIINSAGVLVSQNIIDGTTKSGVDGGAILIYKRDGHSISGNIIRNSVTGLRFWNGDSLQSYTSTHVTGNRLDGNTTNAVRAAATSTVRIFDNYNLGDDIIDGGSA